MAISRKTNEAPKGVQMDRLTKLAERWESKKSKADDARSDLGTIAKEVEDMGFNRAAFKLTMKLRNMEPEKRNDFTASLNAYCDYFGIWDAQPDLWNDAPSGIGPNNGANDGEVSENAAQLQGEKAGKRGDRVDTNPYDQDTDAGSAWLAGWTEGQADAVRRNIKPLDPGTETQASA
jgi:ribosome modulation factor/uncharacterized protein (UPF0335 family)